MREIKFRVYDKHTGFMHVCGTDSHDEIYFEPSGQASYYNLQNGEGSGEGGAYELMQYTGLKDTNGVEIYEGDIVSMFQGSQKSEVLFDGGMFSVKRAYRTSFYHDELELRHEILFNVIDTCEVIGNIYEKPELLEDTQ